MYICVSYETAKVDPTASLTSVAVPHYTAVELAMEAQRLENISETNLYSKKRKKRKEEAPALQLSW